MHEWRKSYFISIHTMRARHYRERRGFNKKFESGLRRFRGRQARPWGTGGREVEEKGTLSSQSIWEEVREDIFLRARNIEQSSWPPTQNPGTTINAFSRDSPSMITVIVKLTRCPLSYANQVTWLFLWDIYRILFYYLGHKKNIISDISLAHSKIKFSILTTNVSVNF